MGTVEGEFVAFTDADCIRTGIRRKGLVLRRHKVI